jgi:hypothetical protein
VRPLESPFAALRHGCLLGPAEFAGRLKAELPTAPTPRATRQAQALLRDDPELSWPQILGEVCRH